MDPTPLLSTDDVAALAGVSRTTIVNAIDAGELAATKVGRGYVISHEAATEYADAWKAKRKAEDAARRERAREVQRNLRRR